MVPTFRVVVGLGWLVRIRFGSWSPGRVGAVEVVGSRDVG